MGGGRREAERGKGGGEGREGRREERSVKDIKLKFFKYVPYPLLLLLWRLGVSTPKLTFRSEGRKGITKSEPKRPKEEGARRWEG